MMIIESWEQIEKQLLARSTDQLNNLFQKIGENTETLMLSSSSDWGVCRNGGRRGSVYGPQAILNILKKMAFHSRETIISQVEVSNSFMEMENFRKAQALEANAIKKALEKAQPKQVLHLGGGHDHIYPLLKAYEDKSKIHIINIDAHLDTRCDQEPHSGTPFRQFDNEYQGKLKISQVGIHAFANILSNYQDMKGEMEIIGVNCLEEKTQNFSQDLRATLEKLIPIQKDEWVILSLDADAIDGSQMEAVSAVNHRGLPINVVRDLIHYVADVSKQDCEIFGIYEYNPVYDNLSQKGARTLASLIYEFIF